jgi:flagellar hook-length control protein FliK
MIQKISSEIVELAREQGKSMKIQIQPENMGKIDLRLITNSDGMRIVMTTEVPATGKLLETHMDQLQRQLADAGVSISGMSVNSQNAQGQSANASQNQSFGSGRSASPVFLQESEVVPTTTSRVSVSGLDYRI